MDEHSSIRLHHIHVHEYLHCTYIHGCIVSLIWKADVDITSLVRGHEGIELHGSYRVYVFLLLISTASQHARFVRKCEINSIKSIFRTLISILQSKISFAEKRTEETANSQSQRAQPLRTSRHSLYSDACRPAF